MKSPCEKTVKFLTCFSLFLYRLEKKLIGDLISFSAPPKTRGEKEAASLVRDCKNGPT